MSAAKVRLEQELGRLESLLRLLDNYEQEPSDATLALLSQKLKLIVPELRALSLNPAYKTPECAPLLVTLGQGVKSAVARTRTLAEVAASRTESAENSKIERESVSANSASSGGGGAAPADSWIESPRGDILAEPKPMRGFLKKRGDKGLVKNWKLRYFEQRGDKIMYYRSDKSEDLKQAIGWIDLGKMMGVEAGVEPLSFDVRTAGRVYCLQVAPGSSTAGGPPPSRRESMRRESRSEESALLDYWMGGLQRWRRYRQESIARMNQASGNLPASSVSPRSSAWSGMSVMSEDDEDSAVPDPSTPIMREQEPEESPLNRSTEQTRSAMSFRMSPERKSSAKKLLSFEHEESAPAAVIIAAPVVAEPVVSERELQLERENKDMTARFAAMDARFKHEEVLRLQAESTVAALREEVSRAGQQMAQLREAARKDREALEVAEQEAREARMRGTVAEGDLRAARGDLDAERARREKPVPLSSELGRLLGLGEGPMSGGGGSSSSLSGLRGPSSRRGLAESLTEAVRELEKEREASEAQRERVRFLAGQLDQASRMAAAQLSLHEATVAALRHRLRRAREEREKEENGGERAVSDESALVISLKREYFMALGVSMKLQLAAQGEVANLDVSSLYAAEVADVLPPALFNRYLSLRIDQHLYPARRAQLTEDIASMLRDCTDH